MVMAAVKFVNRRDVYSKEFRLLFESMNDISGQFICDEGAVVLHV
jgi:hypothetical protein